MAVGYLESGMIIDMLINKTKVQKYFLKSTIELTPCVLVCSRTGDFTI